MQSCLSEQIERPLIVKDVTTDTICGYDYEGQVSDQKDPSLPGLLSLAAFLLSLLALLLLLLSHHVMACARILTSLLIIILWQEREQNMEQEKEPENEQEKGEV